MQLEQVKEAIATTPKGANIIIEWTRNAKTRKAVTDIITKSTRMVGRMGIEYDNIKNVQVGRALGDLPQTNQGLPNWQEFEVYPYLLKHKANGTRYVRLYKGTSAKVRPNVVWHCNGEVVEKETIAPLLLASEMKKSSSDCFQVKIENVTRLHIEAVAEAERVQAQEKVEVAEKVAEEV